MFQRPIEGDGPTPERVAQESARHMGFIMDLELDDSGRPVTRARAAVPKAPLEIYRDGCALAPGDPELNEARWHAGDRLRADWWESRPDPRVVARYEPPRPPDSGDAPETDADKARWRWRGALRQAGIRCSMVLVHVCLEGGTVKSFAKRKRLPWPGGDLMDLLRGGLDAVGAYYRSRPATDR
ncbi:MAG: DUF6456 domain-containing protein [Xanthobacteraceae bacterium]|nr:DUF6456 domain-containing protein [Xanthobacteraceae bacterium]